MLTSTSSRASSSNEPSGSFDVHTQFVDIMRQLIEREKVFTNKNVKIATYEEFIYDMESWSDVSDRDEILEKLKSRIAEEFIHRYLNTLPDFVLFGELDLSSIDLTKIKREIEEELFSDNIYHLIYQLRSISKTLSRLPKIIEAAIYKQYPLESKLSGEALNIFNQLSQDVQGQMRNHWLGLLRKTKENSSPTREDNIDNLCEFMDIYINIVSEYQKTRAFKENVLRDYTGQFISFCNMLSKHGQLTVHGFENLHEIYQSNFLNETNHAYGQTHLDVLCSLLSMQSRVQYFLLRKEALTELKRESLRDGRRKRAIEGELSKIESSLNVLNENIKSSGNELKKSFARFISDYVELPHEDLSRNISSKLGGSEEREINDIISKSWYETIMSYVSMAMPTWEKIRNVGIGVTAGATVGMVTGMGIFSAFTMPMGMIVGGIGGYISPEVKRQVAQQVEGVANYFRSIAVGEMTTKYSSGVYKVTPEMLSVFRGNEAAAEIANSFYVQILFDLDLKLNTMSRTDRAGEEGKLLQKIYNYLYERYQMVRGNEEILRTKRYAEGAISAEEASQIYIQDLKFVQKLIIDAQKQDTRNYIECLQTLSTVSDKPGSLPNEVKDLQIYKLLPPSIQGMVETGISEERFALTTGNRQETLTITERPSSSISQPIVEEVDDTSEIEHVGTRPNIQEVDEPIISEPGPASTSAIVQRSSSMVVSPHLREESILQRQQHDLALQKFEGLAMQVVHYEQRKNGYQADLERLKFVVDTTVDSLEQAQAFARALDEERRTEYKKHTKSPLNLSLAECLFRLKTKGNSDYLLHWFKEGLLKGQRSESHENLRLEASGRIIEPYSKKVLFDGMSLWHILADDPNGVEIFKAFVEAQNQEVLVARGWQLGDYFDPNVTYRDLNPLQYAAQRNPELLKLYLQELNKSHRSLTRIEFENMFDYIMQDPQARLLVEAIEGWINVERSSKTHYGYSTLSAAVSGISSMSVRLVGVEEGFNVIRFQILAALAIRLSYNESIPRTSHEIELFCSELMETQHSKYYTVDAFAQQRIPLERLKGQSQTIAGYLESHEILAKYARESTNINASHIIPSILSSQPFPNVLEQELLIAIFESNLRRVTELLPQVDKQKKYADMNVLYIAAKASTPEVALYLYRNSVNVDNAGPPDDPSAFTCAARENIPVCCAISQELMKTRVNLAGMGRMMVDKHGKYPILYLCERANPVQLCQFLDSERRYSEKLGKRNFSRLFTPKDNTDRMALHYILSREDAANILNELQSYISQRERNKTLLDWFGTTALLARDKSGISPLDCLATNPKSSEIFPIILNELLLKDLLNLEHAQVLAQTVKKIGIPLNGYIEKHIPVEIDYYYAKDNIYKYQMLMNMALGCTDFTYWEELLNNLVLAQQNIGKTLRAWNVNPLNSKVFEGVMNSALEAYIKNPQDENGVHLQRAVLTRLSMLFEAKLLSPEYISQKISLLSKSDDIQAHELAKHLSEQILKVPYELEEGWTLMQGQVAVETLQPRLPTLEVEPNAASSTSPEQAQKRQRPLSFSSSSDSSDTTAEEVITNPTEEQRGKIEPKQF